MCLEQNRNQVPFALATPSPRCLPRVTGGVFFDLSKHAQSRGQLAISLRLCSLVDVRSANHEWASKVVKHIHSTL